MKRRIENLYFAALCGLAPSREALGRTYVIAEGAVNEELSQRRERAKDRKDLGRLVKRRTENFFFAALGGLAPLREEGRDYFERQPELSAEEISQRREGEKDRKDLGRLVKRRTENFFFAALGGLAPLREEGRDYFERQPELSAEEISQRREGAKDRKENERTKRDNGRGHNRRSTG
ncbi:MAG: hypothetical protein IPM63_07830 [Acidobacteriota bacterium]|nr:MAG: hypothetical protein IPM63_07830 [Acidobacteriota bacterium]